MKSKYFETTPYPIIFCTPCGTEASIKFSPGDFVALFLIATVEEKWQD